MIFGDGLCIEIYIMRAKSQDVAGKGQRVKQVTEIEANNFTCDGVLGREKFDVKHSM